MADKELQRNKRKSGAFEQLPSIAEDNREDPIHEVHHRKDSGESTSKHHPSRSVTFATFLGPPANDATNAGEDGISGQQKNDVTVAPATHLPQPKPVVDEYQSSRWQHAWKVAKKNAEPASSNVEASSPPSKPENPAREPSQIRSSLRYSHSQNADVKQDILTPSTIAIATGIPPEALKKVRVQQLLPKPGTSPERPLAPKVLVLKRAPPTLRETPPESAKYPFVLHEEEMLEEAPEDKQIDKKLTELMNEHRDYVLRNLKRSKKASEPKYKFSEMVDTLAKQGIPCPVNEDYGRLHGVHSKWDPKGTVLEYYSPMLRTFVPVNMRGRYRGCWSTDNCVKGVNISNIKPKTDAIEAFVERGRHNHVQAKYDEMSSIASDEAHLDYLVGIESFHAEALPIPIFYDLLHLGMEVTNENLRILVQAEGYAPNDPIFISVKGHAEQLRRKIQMYGALGLETLESERKGLGQYRPEWLKSRDEIIRDIMTFKDTDRYTDLQKTEKQAGMKGNFRREQTKPSSANWRTSKSRGTSFMDSHTSEGVHFKQSSGDDQPRHTNMESNMDVPESTASLGAIAMGSTATIDLANLPESTAARKSHLLEAMKKLGKNQVTPESQSGMKDHNKLPSASKENTESGKKEG